MKPNLLDIFHLSIDSTLISMVYTGGGVQSVLFDSGPATSARTLYLLLLPNENFPVI